MHEPFHDNLAGESAGDGAALTARQKCDGEQNACRHRAQERGQREIGDANPIAVVAEFDHAAAGRCTLFWPKNTIAARTMIAALTKNASDNATSESTVLN